MRIPKELHDALVLLNVWGMFTALARGAQDFESAEAGLVELQRTADANYKAQALRAHPDRGGDEERMKALNVARALVAKVHIERPRPQPVVTVIHVQVGGFGATNFTTGSATSSTGWF